MRSEVTVTFENQPLVQIDLHDAAPLPSEAARRWLDEQFTQMGCEPLTHRQAADRRQGGGGGRSGRPAEVCRRRLGAGVFPCRDRRPGQAAGEH